MARHRDEAERAKWVARWQASGVSCERFAGKHGLSPSTLYRWSQRAGGGAAVKSQVFTEVRVVGEAVCAGLEVEHPSGCVVRVHGAVDEEQLAAVLRAISTC